MLQVMFRDMFAQGRLRNLTVALAGLAVIGVFGCAYATPPKQEGESRLRLFLQKYLKKSPSVLDQGLRYSAASVSLDGNSGHQYLVYLTSRWWCGSGGCTALLLEPYDSSFRVIDKFSLARLPIRILPSKTDGWHDLAMPVSGGGIIKGYMAFLRFDGHKYPSNPSMAPRLPGKLAGTGMEVPLSEKGSLVY